MNPSDLAAAVDTSAGLLRARLGERRPRIAVLLGSGWGPCADAVTDALNLFEDTVRDKPAMGEEVEPTIEQEERDAEFRARLRGAA